MRRHNTLISLFIDIADAIRNKIGNSDAIKADDFDLAIAAIDTDPSGDATASSGDILFGKTAYSQGNKITGTIETYMGEVLGRECLTFTAEEAGSTIGLASKHTIAELKYSFDKIDWTELNVGNTITLNNIGDKVYFRGSSDDGALDCTQFAMTGKIAASGSIMSILCDNPDATELPHSRCCCSMFQNCVSLTRPPELPAIVLTPSCYQSMFYGCTSLTQSPELPATTLTGNGYYYMFYNCTSLTQAPELPATNLEWYCYGSMFNGCTSLAQTPELLPATTLAENCYSDMFYDCTSLIQAPQLPATTLTPGCYSDMFWNCASLIQAPELPATTLAPLCYSGMFAGCVSLTQLPELPATTLMNMCYRWMFNECTSIKLSETQTDKYQIPYRIPSNGVGTDAQDALYNMFRYTGGTFTGDPNINQTYYLWDENYTPSHDYLTFTAEEANSTIGLIWKNSTAELKYSYDKVSWTELNAGDTIGLINIGDKVYFRGSSISGTSAYTNFTQFAMTGRIAASGSIMSILCDDPDATQVPHDYCCLDMFRACDSLTQPPELPAIILSQYCYKGIFYGCTSLTRPPELPATTLALECYYDMFYRCTNLTQAPELPATTLAIGCYQNMFRNCTSLTQPPELPATTLAGLCYEGMFYNCTSLIQTPELPAMTLAPHCYTTMFHGCTSLTQLPDLPATTLEQRCYQEMFRGCTSIKLSEYPGGKYQIPYRIPSSGTGTDASGALSHMFDDIGGELILGTPDINETYYLWDYTLSEPTLSLTTNNYEQNIIDKPNNTTTEGGKSLEL